MLRVLLLAALLSTAGIAPAQSAAQNVFLVLEESGAILTVVDGERLEPVQRFAAKRPLAGAPRFTADSRFAFFASGDGWIVKYDLRTFAAVAETHAGEGAGRFAASADGNHVAVASDSPRGLALLDGELRPRKILASSSRIAAVLHAARRKSFVIAFDDLAELWEVSYDPKAEPIAEGVVHDFRLKEGTFVEGFLNPRRTKLEQPLDAAFFLAEGSLVLGMQRDGRRAVAIQLDIRRPIAGFELPGLPHPGGSSSWVRNGRRVMAIPNLCKPILSIVDADNWKVVTHVGLRGPPELARSSVATPYAWVGPLGPSRDTLQIVDKETLQAVLQITPEPGSRILQLDFDRSGRHALVRISEALIAFEASTLREVRRIPLRGGPAAAEAQPRHRACGNGVAAKPPAEK